MLNKIISLLFLLGIHSISQNMQFLLQEDEISSKNKLAILIKTFSLKKQVAIKIIIFINKGLIDSDQLNILPTELISYLEIHAQIDSLNPESPAQCVLNKNIKTNFNFLTSIYLIDENSILFNNLNLLVNGLQKIDLSQKFQMQVSINITYESQSEIDPINILSKIINKKLTDSSDENTDEEFKKLVKHSIQFNNLDLLDFLNLAYKIPIKVNCNSLQRFGSSVLDLACISTENNCEMINFLIANITQSGLDWRQLISEGIILRAMFSRHIQKRSLLIQLAQDLNINSNQYIGFPVEKCQPILLSVGRGYDEVFNFFLPRLQPFPDSSSSLTEVYNNIIDEFSRTEDTQDEKELAAFLTRELAILDVFHEHIIKKNDQFAIEKESKIRTLRDTLNNKLKNIN